MSEQKLTLPYPPSANRYWRNFQGIMRTSNEAIAYKSDVRKRGAIARSTPFAGAVSVSIDLYRPQKSGDLDNRLKVIFDALQGVLFADDKQIVEIHARRFDDKTNPRAEVTVSSLPL